jgi:alcohol-forming fatty acyl-CoA reductase
MPLESVNSTADFYGTQTVFLTGSTGGLGGCLLYKLALVLRTPKIYVLVRGSAEKALERWRPTMPAQVNELIRWASITFVVRDMTR